MVTTEPEGLSRACRSWIVRPKKKLISVWLEENHLYLFHEMVLCHRCSWQKQWNEVLHPI